MTVSLRLPVAADYAVIAGWIADAAACARWAGPQLAYPFEPVQLPQLLHVQSGASYTLCEGDADILGFGQYRLRQPGVAHLCRIAIAPQARGRGLGKILCSLLLEEAVRAYGVSAATLRVYRDNPAAHAIYAGLGFVEVAAESTPEVLWMQAQISHAGLAMPPLAADAIKSA
ncbi:ribosomal protein S18 acetylase RimI-like enzyme [Collimonas sp. PA-H2]|uniref:GNAT family N-acetyltransferase n=1 Tax=Collimonas sp. PA-H2 TaxID=1881062 RepID=UPI000C01C101|nr:GNAT family N-acetyltransferase [Collimonas sp. PA-H2]PFH07754.1 ribosomal protein S18 acetylase RimI-like enzyme [Collimonas sp. PA-H2]